MRSKRAGLPHTADPDAQYRMYEGVEYKDYWNDVAKTNCDKLEKAIVSKLIPTSGYRIIDVGCGFGRLSGTYLNRFEQAVMLDGSMSLLRQAKETIGKNAFYIAADANCLPFRPSSFDCALMIRVFHHFQDSKVIMAEMRRVIGNRGTLVFNYANTLNARRLLRWVLRLTNENPLTMEPKGIVCHFIHYHPAYVQRLLKQNGFCEMKYLGTGILDKLPLHSEGLLFLAEALAPVFGVSKLAPWINCRAVVSSAIATEVGKNIDELFICPSCHGELSRKSFVYTCSSCERSFSSDDGILDFRIR